VVPDGWELPDSTPGQFAVLGLPGHAPRCLACDPEDPLEHPDNLIKRAYSIASSSLGKEYLEFYIVRVPSGALTPRLFALSNGDPFWLSTKITGMFTLQDVELDKHIVLVSTGTGLAPYVSMLRTELACGDNRRFAVLHGARHSWDLGYRGELRTLDRICPNFTYVPSITRPSEEHAAWGGMTGYIQDLWESMPLQARWGFKPSPSDTHVFVCGNPSGNLRW
jgi:ferredoxin--NADP+ reductase